MSGQTGHFACTACGRGYANTDDAEECFERCLARMKPNAQFEQALRRVQVRYLQRLQSHGVRSLQRIDPFIEHTKMLNTLTQEQVAMGRPVAQPDPLPSQKSKVVHSTSAPSLVTAVNEGLPETKSTTNISPAGAALESSEEQDDVSSPADAQLSHATDEGATFAEDASLTADLETASEAESNLNFETAGSVQLTQEFAPPDENDVSQEFTPSEQAELDSDFTDNAVDELDTESATLSAEMPDPEEANALLTANALSVLDKIAATANRKAAKPAPQQRAAVRPAQTKSPAAKPAPAVFDDTSSTTALTAMLDDTPLTTSNSLQDPLADDRFFKDSSPTAISILKQQQFSQTEPSDAADSGSALTMLATSTPQATQIVNKLSAASVSAKRDKDSFDFDMAMEEGDLSSAFSEASEFAQVAEQPETNVLAADVLALLQTSSTDQNLELSSKQTKYLKSKQIEVDLDLLEKLTTNDGSANDATVHLRKVGIKSYRRNNAKYNCSACSREFFTKEQVEACFYSHPEEGSEEARVLIERAKKTAAKTAA